MALKQALLLCDPSSADELTGVYQHFSDLKHFEKHLVACLVENDSHRAASWVLKHHLEQGFLLSDKHTKTVLLAYLDMEHWEARLHILQSIGFLMIPDALTNALYSQLRHQLSDKNKFIRAWTYNALHELAQQQADFQNDVNELLKIAMKEEAPSVTARIRKILKTGLYD